jgi:hypothetical protein
MRVFEYPLVVNQSMAADYTGASQQMVQMVMGAIAARFSGTPNGTLKLQISNDNSNWTDYTDSDYALTTSGSVSWNLNNIGYQYVRVVYTRNSGTGTLNVTVSGKGV